MALFACASFYIGEWNFFREISFSPMIIGIILGMIYANTLRMNLPATWTPGIQYCSKRILRLGIILYGFRLTLQNVADVGLAAIVIDTIIVTVTILGGVWIGRLLKMDRETALLTSIGSGICGAAAVLGAEATMRTKPYKTAVAVATVVIFGTLLMFLYPVAYRTGILELTPEQMGIYSGSTLHEVAHAVGAGNAMGGEIADISIIVKMIRVMTLVPAYSELVDRGARQEKRRCGSRRKERESGCAMVRHRIPRSNRIQFPRPDPGSRGGMDQSVRHLPAHNGNGCSRSGNQLRQIQEGWCEAVPSRRHTLRMAHKRRLPPRPVCHSTIQLTTGYLIIHH